MNFFPTPGLSLSTGQASVPTTVDSAPVTKTGQGHAAEVGDRTPDYTAHSSFLEGLISRAKTSASKPLGPTPPSVYAEAGVASLGKVGLVLLGLAVVGVIAWKVIK